MNKLPRKHYKAHSSVGFSRHLGNNGAKRDSLHSSHLNIVLTRNKQENDDRLHSSVLKKKKNELEQHHLISLSYGPRSPCCHEATISVEAPIELQSRVNMVIEMFKDR